MAAGALARSGVDLVFAITGIAGPGGGSPAKPVGLVHFASARRDGALFHERRVFPGYRDQVRCQSVAFAFDLVSRHL
jgi:nicotinamide-nucleotide amidase